MRTVKLGSEVCYLEGKEPSVGSILDCTFLIPEVTGTSAIADINLKKDLIIISTLPNVAKDHCIQQIVELETLAKKLLPGSVKIYHVSSDSRLDWKTAQSKIPFSIKAYTLYDAVQISRFEFKEAFGVGVVGSERLAHGLFALFRGQFIAVQIPNEQLGVPNIPLFINQILNTKFY